MPFRKTFLYLFTPSEETAEDNPGICRWGPTAVTARPVAGKPHLVEVRVHGEMAWVPKQEVSKKPIGKDVWASPLQLIILKCIAQGKTLYPQWGESIRAAGFSSDPMAVFAAYAPLLTSETVTTSYKAVQFPLAVGKKRGYELLKKETAKWRQFRYRAIARALAEDNPWNKVVGFRNKEGLLKEKDEVTNTGLFKVPFPQKGLITREKRATVVKYRATFCTGPSTLHSKTVTVSRRMNVWHYSLTPLGRAVLAEQG